MPDLGGADMFLALEDVGGPLTGGFLASPFWQSREEAKQCCTQVLENHPPTISNYVFGAKFLEEQPETAEAIIQSPGAEPSGHTYSLDTTTTPR